MTTHNPGEQNYYPPAGDNQLGYLLYRPPKVHDTVERKWPVLCFLHGAGEAAKDKNGNDQSIDVLMNHGTPPWHCAINSPLIRGFIVLSPQLPYRRRWERQDLYEVEQILKTTCQVFGGDPQKIYLTGFSYGGEGVFDFATWRKDLWAGLWPVDDAHKEPPLYCDVQRIWLHFGSWHPKHHTRIVENLKLQQAGTFRNGYVPNDRLFTDYSKLGYEHSATCVASYADWRVYEWLLSS